MNRRLAGAPLLALAVLASCATRKDLDRAPSDAGVARGYAFPAERVRAACQDALAEAHFRPVEKYTRPVTAERFRIMASRGVDSGSSGRNARVDIESGAAGCTVWVLVWSKLESREAISDDALIAQDLHKRIAARLQ